jgi:hypothetical protein
LGSRNGSAVASNTLLAKTPRQKESAAIGARAEVCPWIVEGQYWGNLQSKIETKEEDE